VSKEVNLDQGPTCYLYTTFFFAGVDPCISQNSIAGAASLVELEQQHQLTQQQEQQELNLFAPPFRPSQHLQQAVAQIYRTMHW